MRFRRAAMLHLLMQKIHPSEHDLHMMGLGKHFSEARETFDTPEVF